MSGPGEKHQSQARDVSPAAQQALARLSAHVEAALACLMEYEAQQATQAHAADESDSPAGQAQCEREKKQAASNALAR